MKFFSTLINEVLVKKNLINTKKEWKKPEYKKGDKCLLITVNKYSGDIMVDIIKITSILKTMIHYDYMAKTHDVAYEKNMTMGYVQRWIDNPPPIGGNYMMETGNSMTRILITSEDSYDILENLKKHPKLDYKNLLWNKDIESESNIVIWDYADKKWVNITAQAINNLIKFL